MSEQKDMSCTPNKNISAAEILASYKRVQNHDAELDLRNKFRAILYYYVKDGAVSDNTLKTVAASSQSEFVCLLLARKGLTCYRYSNDSHINYNQGRSRSKTQYRNTQQGGESSESGDNSSSSSEEETESEEEDEEDVITCVDGKCTDRDIKTVRTTYSNVINNKSKNNKSCVGPCSGYYFSDLLLDNDKAIIKSKDDFIRAIQSFSQNAISRYHVTAADVDLLPIAIEHYNALAIEKILPFAKFINMIIKIPDIQGFPRLQLELSRFKRDTVWYSQLLEVQKENQRRIAFWKSRYSY